MKRHQYRICVDNKDGRLLPWGIANGRLSTPPMCVCVAEDAFDGVHFMDNLLQHILLGIVQGVTEFLPVSSSGHLVVLQKLLGIEKEGILLDVSLHFGTLLAILVVFRRELWDIMRDSARGICLITQGYRSSDMREQAPLFYVGAAVAVGTIPVVLAGTLLDNVIRNFFHAALPVTGGFLIVTGLILLASRFAPDGETTEVHPAKGFLVGLAQMLALLPGISRSGTTIVAGYYLGVSRSAAARFSFLLAVPALLGAMILETIKELGTSSFQISDAGQLAELIAGTGTAAVVGGICLVALLSIVQRGKLYWFAAYCIPMGTVLVASEFFWPAFS